VLFSLFSIQEAARMSAALPAAARAAARDLRRLRILASLQAGLSYAAIGRAEGLSRERLLAKLNAMVERMIAARKSGLVDADGRPCPQSARSPLTRRTALISLTIPPRRQAPDLTPLDKT
jgi:hypothetical protein